MTPPKGSAPSTWLRLLALLLCASALPACKTSSTRPVAAPTPPPVVVCDQTPPPAQIPPIPRLRGASDLAPSDAWIAQLIGLYQGEVTIRMGEHKCWNALRAKGLIR